MAMTGERRDSAEAFHAGLTVFTDAVRVVHGPGDVDTKYEWTIEMAKTMSGARLGAVIGHEGEDQEIAVLSGDRLFEDRLDDLRPLLATVLTQGQTVTALAVPDEELHSLVAVPVPAPSGCHGALVLGAATPGAFDEVAIDAVRALAANLGVALDNLAATTRLAELDTARREVVHQLQEAVRPAIPGVADTALGVYYLAADPQEPTGGDLYDWHVLPGGDLYLAVIDIVGKGVAATKDAVALVHVLRVLVLQGVPLAKVVREADDLLGLHHPELAATIVVARYDPSSGVLQIASGGHPPPLVVRANGRTEYIALEGAPLGFPGAGSSEIATIHLGRSDSVIFYTDGVVEAHKDIVTGLEDLARSAAVTSRYPARQQARVLVERALAGAARRDDSLVVVLRRRIPPTGPASRRLGQFEYKFSPNPVSVGIVRHFLADWLRFQELSDVDAEDPLLIASELTANAIAATADGQAPAYIRAWADGASLVIEVENQSGDIPDFPATSTDELPDLDAESGRGLFVVRALSDELHILSQDGTTIVRSISHGFFPERR